MEAKNSNLQCYSDSKILIVDDIPENIQLLGEILKKKGYKISFATNGHEAILIANEVLPDLVLLDVQMPEIDGFMVCEKLKNDPKTGDIPIIFLTAKSDINDIVKGFEVGGSDYIIKPFKSQEVFARVRAHLEIKKSKEIILKKTKELEESNNTKDKFCSIIAHDLKNPISVLSGFLQILNNELKEIKFEDLQGIIEILNNSAGQTAQLLENLLEWASCQRGIIEYKFENHSIRPIVDNVVLLFALSAKKKSLQLLNEVDENVTAYFDKNTVTTVIRNLVSNALKFTEKGEIKISANESENFVEISVSDSGKGIRREIRNNLFKLGSNVTTKGTNGEQGSGLGLILCKDFVDDNHGKIWFDSELSVGTTFYFTLPSSSRA